MKMNINCSANNHSLTNQKENHRSAAGFTLIEIMVVVVILGILAATIIPQFIGTTDSAKIGTANSNIAEMETQIERFSLDVGRYPTTQEGLSVLVEAPADEEAAAAWRGPYIKLLRDDPWGNPYQYASPSTHGVGQFDVWSMGADGADGGEGDNADIGSWQK